MSQGENIGQIGHVEAPVMREVSAPAELDIPNMSTKDLLNQFWIYVRNPLSDVASALVNMIGKNAALPVVTGELAELVKTAAGLKKAYGRNIPVELVSRDLQYEVPAEYSPRFMLYLQAGRIKPDDSAERATTTAVKRAIRTKIRGVRSGKVVLGENA